MSHLAIVLGVGGDDGEDSLCGGRRGKWFSACGWYDGSGTIKVCP